MTRTATKLVQESNWHQFRKGFLNTLLAALIALTIVWLFTLLSSTAAQRDEYQVLG